MLFLVKQNFDEGLFGVHAKRSFAVQSVRCYLIRMPKDKQNIIPGVILAGGRSSRMFDGRTGDKALLALGGQTVLAHVIGRLGPQTAGLVLNANGDVSRFQIANLNVIADSLPDHPGPMAGILAGLRWAAATYPNASHILTAPCDEPFLPLDLAARLTPAAPGPDQIVLAASKSGEHYVTGLWPVALANELERDIRAGRLKVSQWVKAHGAHFVMFDDNDFDGQSIDPFFNINTPDDLAVAERWIAHAAQQQGKLFGIAGWKNSGKTTLTVKLVAELKARGFRVATVKCSHHGFDEENPRGHLRDTDLHRVAGASVVAFLGPDEFGIVGSDGALRPCLKRSPDRMHDLLLLIEGMTGADVILVEGFKSAPFVKIEVRPDAASTQRPLASHDENVVAVALEHPETGPRSGEAPQVSVFSRDNVEALADVVQTSLRLKAKMVQA